jgi:hypothetical protein
VVDIESAKAREGFVEVRCSSCPKVMQHPLGPDFWHPATGGVIRSKIGFKCECGTELAVVTLDMIVVLPDDWFSL